MDKSAEAVAHLFVRAINRQDAAGLADLMTREHRFVDSLGNVVVGQEEARQGWLGYFSIVPDYSITVQESYGTGPVVINVRHGERDICAPSHPSARGLLLPLGETDSRARSPTHN